MHRPHRGIPSFSRKREPRSLGRYWTPAFAGVTRFRKGNVTAAWSAGLMALGGAQRST